MADVWTPLLANLPLSKSERDVARRFSAEPLGRSFLPVADILRAHRLVDESLELLTHGVERHPGFTVARVVLARELLAKGMIDTSWTLLEQAADSLRENVLAQKLRFKLALLLAHEADARASYQHLKLMQMLDPEVKRLGELLEVSGISEARQKLHPDHPHTAGTNARAELRSIDRCLSRRSVKRDFSTRGRPWCVQQARPWRSRTRLNHAR